MKRIIILVSFFLFIKCVPSIDGNTFCDQNKNNTPLLSVTTLKLLIIDKSTNQSVFLSTNTGFNKDSLKISAGNTEITYNTEAFKNDTIITQQWYVLFNYNRDN